MKTLTKKDAQAIINWFDTVGQSNWGVWGHYPKLSFGASYLSYETSLCQINLDETILFNGDEINCITIGRFSVGKKWNKNTTFEDLKEWAIDGYLDIKKAKSEEQSNSILAAFDASPVVVAQYAEVRGLSNNKRKIALSAALRSIGITSLSNLDMALINAGRRNETPYSI